MDDPKNKGKPDRSKTSMHEAHAVIYWIEQLGIDRQWLQKVVDEVGTSAAAFRKEIAALQSYGNGSRRAYFFVGCVENLNRNLVEVAWGHV